MKKRLFVLWILLAITSVTVVYVAFSIRSLNQSLLNAQNLVSELVTSEADAVLSTIRDDILNGNLTQIGVSFARVMENSHFVGLVLRPKSGSPTKIPNDFKTTSSTINVERNVFFADGGVDWGKVSFLYDSTAVDKLKGEIVGQFLRSLYFIFGLILATVVSLLYFLFKITDSILVAFEASVTSSASVRNRISWFDPKRIWLPTYARVNEFGLDYRRHRDKIELMREKEASSRVIAQIAHDLRTPLSGIRIAMSLLQATNERAFEVGNRSLERAEAILNEALKVWKKDNISQDKVSRAILPFCEAKGVILNVIKEYQLSAPSFKILAEEMDLPTCTLGISADDLTRVFQSIINNSIDSQSAQESPQVQIVMELIEGMVRIQFRDFGPGFSDVSMFKAFEDGFSEKRAESNSGTGMGLFDIRQRLLSNGGIVGIANAVSPPGAIVSIVFPMLRN